FTPDSLGLYSSTLVTTWNMPYAGGYDSGKVHATAPGIATITYTLPSGCFSSVTITVNPLPGPFIDTPYKVCAGSTKILSDPPGPGTWSATSGIVLLSAIG